MKAFFSFLVLFSLSIFAQVTPTCTVACQNGLTNSITIAPVTPGCSNSVRKIPVELSFSQPVKGFIFKVRFKDLSTNSWEFLQENDPYFSVDFWPYCDNAKIWNPIFNRKTGVLTVVVAGAEMCSTLSGYITVPIGQLPSYSSEIYLHLETATYVLDDDSELTLWWSAGQLNSGSIQILPTPSQYGDVNLDGRLTISDIVKTLDASSGKIQLTPSQVFSADCDGDNKITALDAWYASRRLAGDPSCLPVELNCYYGGGVGKPQKSPIELFPVATSNGVNFIFNSSDQVKYGDINLSIPDGVKLIGVEDVNSSINDQGRKITVSFYGEKNPSLKFSGPYSLIKGIGISGTVNNNIPVKLNTNNLTGINNGKNSPEKEFVLQQNYPNPFNPTTAISYQISKPGFVTLKVYDMLGKEIATLVNEEKPTGSYSVKFDASNLPSGVYVYRLSAGNFIKNQKMILAK